MTCVSRKVCAEFGKRAGGECFCRARRVPDVGVLIRLGLECEQKLARRVESFLQRGLLNSPLVYTASCPT